MSTQTGRGVASQLFFACADAARAAGFTHLELMAPLPGEPLYRAFGFAVIERVETVLPDGVVIPFVRMARELEGNGR